MVIPHSEGFPELLYLSFRFLLGFRGQYLGEWWVLSETFVVLKPIPIDPTVGDHPAFSGKGLASELIDSVYLHIDPLDDLLSGSLLGAGELLEEC